MSYHGQERYNGSLFTPKKPKPRPISREEELRMIEQAASAGKLRRCLPINQIPTLLFDEALAVLKAAGVKVYTRRRNTATTYSLVSDKMTPDDFIINAARAQIAIGKVTWPMTKKEAA
jgi:hypothetical protein